MRCDGMRCDAMGCVALRCVAMGWDGMRWDAMGCDGMRCVAMGCDAMRCDAMRCGHTSIEMDKGHTVDIMMSSCWTILRYGRAILISIQLRYCTIRECIHYTYSILVVRIVQGRAGVVYVVE